MKFILKAVIINFWEEHNILSIARGKNQNILQVNCKKEAVQKVKIWAVFFFILVFFLPLQTNFCDFSRLRDKFSLFFQ